MVTVYYINSLAETFPYRTRLHALGLKWDGARKEWWAADRDTVLRGAVVCSPDSPREIQGEYKASNYPKASRGRQWGSKSVKSVKSVSPYKWDDQGRYIPSPTPVNDATDTVLPDTDTAQQLVTLLAILAGQSVNPDTVKQIVQDEMRPLADALANLTAQPNRVIDVRLQSANGVTVKTLDGATHKLLPDLLETINAGMMNLCLVGPSGSGKTTLAHQVASALSMEFASVSCSAGLTESVLLGRLLPLGENGRFSYQQTPFVTLYENGGVFLLDEIDAADANTLLVLNSALSNGHLDIPNRTETPVAKRHPDFVLIVAGNTWGSGASREYVGRNQLDAAFLSRFAGCMFLTDYDRDLEASLVSASMGDAALASQWLSRSWAIRDRLTSLSIRRIWGTREVLSGCRLLSMHPSVPFAVERLTVSWTNDEISKVA